MRVGGTRVTLETVIGAFKDGATPEEILQQYPSLTLAHIYQVLAFYLGNTEQVESYISKREALGVEIQRGAEARWSPAGIRDRLLTRKNPAAT